MERPDNAGTTTRGNAPTREETTQETFDVLVCDQLRRCFQDILQKHPEVSALAGIVCWKGALNQASIHHGVWLGRQGPVLEPEAIFGSLFQTIKMLEEQQKRALEFFQLLKEETVRLGLELTRQYEAMTARQAPHAPAPPQ